jgi:hypothetical protein
MSYRYSVLADNPIVYYSGAVTEAFSVPSYQDILNDYETYEEFKDAFANYSLDSGNAAVDVSGCQNNGFYSGEVKSDIFPLIYGDQYALKIDTVASININNARGYNGEIVKGGFARSSFSDNTFSFEVFIYPFINTNETALIPIVGDLTNGVGIFYNNGNIVFKLNQYSIEYTLPYKRKTYHIAAVYNKDSAMLYIDGQMVSSIDINDFKFTNSNLSLLCGPTQNTGNYFLVNGLAIYRYALTDTKIKNHYLSATSARPQDVYGPLNGKSFEINDSNYMTDFVFRYPADKDWSDIVVDGVDHNTTKKTLSISKTDLSASSTVEIVDMIYIPYSLTPTSSKIEWAGDNGVTVFTSTDGISFEPCENNSVIPQYTKTSFSQSRKLYVKIVFASTDTSKYIPSLEYLIIKMYADNKEYSNNSQDFLYPGDHNIGIGNRRYPITSRDSRNGVNVEAGSGFFINTSSQINTIETFYTPNSTSAGSIINGVSWNSLGQITIGPNVLRFYVNGVSKILDSNISTVFEPGQIYHILIVLRTPISGEIEFNGSGPKALYQSMTLYEKQFNVSECLYNYSLYTGRQTVVVNDSGIGMTESSVEYYDNDWVVLQSS